uniref:Putative e3 ubiquitin ligase n=1 Tax=Panstrongylus lignarius TaxID=156445 RepID=A0A224XNQ8_9HEMI
MKTKMIWFREAFLLFLTTSVTGDVQIYPQFGMPHIIADFSDMPARFGEIIPSKGISAYVVYANPEHACTKIDPPPNNVTNLTNRWAVLIRRYNCSFEEKVLNAQNASFDVAIIHNVNSNKLERMHANDPDKIHIPSIFVGASTGRAIKSKYQYFNGFLIQISEDSPWDYNKIFIPFLIVILLCFFTMIGFMVAKCIKDHRRARRRRLPHSSLRKIPVTKYRKGDPYETCAICLDDFIEGEKLRILPCSHAYHCKCIDPWLTRNRRVCPMCKRKVFAQNEQISDNDSMSDDDDHTPLLRSAQRTHGGTFTRENTFTPPVERNSLPSTSSIEERVVNNDGRSVESGLDTACCNACNGNYHPGLLLTSTSCGSQYCSSNEQCCCRSRIEPNSSFYRESNNDEIDVPSVITSVACNSANERINDISCDACIGRTLFDDNHGELTSNGSSENPAPIK